MAPLAKGAVVAVAAARHGMLLEVIAAGIPAIVATETTALTAIPGAGAAAATATLAAATVAANPTSEKPRVFPGIFGKRISTEAVHAA